MTRVITVSQRGTLTLPKEVRALLGVSFGGQLILHCGKSGGVTLRPAVEIYTEARIREFDRMNNTALAARRLRQRKSK